MDEVRFYSLFNIAKTSKSIYKYNRIISNSSGVMPPIISVNVHRGQIICLIRGLGKRRPEPILSFFQNSNAFLRKISFLIENCLIDHSGQKRTGNRRYNEKPQLFNCPAAYEKGLANAAGRIHRSICYGNTDQVDQCQ